MNWYTIKWGSKFLSSLLKLNPELKKAKALKEEGDWRKYKSFVDGCLCGWLNPLIAKAGVNFNVYGKENIPENEPIIYTPNHAGIFDIPSIILNAPEPPIFIAKKELKSVPVLSDWMYVLDCVFVDRNNKNSARSSLHEAIEMVKNGRSVVVFPEGTRSKDGTLGEFKGGAMKIAMETGAKVVPVLLRGTRERLEEKGEIVPGEIDVVFLPYIKTKGLSREDFFSMPEKIRQLIKEENENFSKNKK
ncbi:MAG: 1-acyl-sn-glycerol-3-phosphate acyltransferase [Clostridia bacterium]|nr:1-acyl-sn-glycerol-3-phosphate acyltransferase [Clostridia bacterium]